MICLYDRRYLESVLIKYVSEIQTDILELQCLTVINATVKIRSDSIDSANFKAR